MKLTLKQVWESRNALEVLVGFEMEAKGKYWIAKQAKKIFTEVENIELRRKELVKKYGTATNKKGEFVVDDDKVKKFQDEFDDLLKEEVDLSVQTIKWEYIEPLKTTPAVLMLLDYLIAEPTDDKPKPKKTK